MTKKSIKRNKFIDYLDSYDKKSEPNTLDYSILSSLIKDHFSVDKIDDKNILGSLYKNKSIADVSLNTYGAPNNNSYYSLFDTSYYIWQNQHEALVDVGIDVNRDVSNIKPFQAITRSEQIEVSINSLSDIINIIDTIELRDDTQYNIDLKSLHNIKTELVELNNMIGMENMKQSVIDQLLYFIQNLHIGKNKDSSDFKHTAIYGPPGTGKTEIAKIIGKMYSKLGILKNNVFKKVTRSDLIGGYLGQTAIKTKKVIEECIGGVLFIDEAYSLANGEREDSYSKECLDTICEALSDYKNELMVIIAGYENELNETFFRVNKGLQSRFIWRFTMDEYNPLELMKIFKKKVSEQDWQFEDENEIKEKWFNDKKENFKSYGRDMELLLTYIKISHGRRIYGKDNKLKRRIKLDDMDKGYDVFLKNKNLKKERVIFGLYV
jgi:SpoVK/Ycf46/Vps4 family AAA+-type ATPase|uniref:AAA+ ATPase domain-containing protein n=1 Tax=viral metagenome TaxID=1070528 RepID=A0A6C0JKF7_9ZZZZ